MITYLLISITGGRSQVYTSGDDNITKYHLKRKRDIDLQKLEQQETAGGDGKKADAKKDDSDDEVSASICINDSILYKSV